MIVGGALRPRARGQTCDRFCESFNKALRCFVFVCHELRNEYFIVDLAISMQSSEQQKF